MNLLLFLPWCKTAPLRAGRRPPADDGELPCEAEDRPLGCGWFDSSLDLNSGLMVHKHACVDAVAGEVPLAFWLDVKLASCRGGVA
jgi:hypothetical protein